MCVFCSKSIGATLSQIDEMDGKVGLFNCGNTCYMSAALQVLAHCTPLTDAVLSCEGHVQFMESSRQELGHEHASLSGYLRHLIYTLWNTDKKAISPQFFVSHVRKLNPMYNSYQQQDSQEFLRYLLSTMDDELQFATEEQTPIARLGTKPSATRSIISDIFEGKLLSSIVCDKCGKASNRTEAFTDFVVDIPSNDKVAYYHGGELDNGPRHDAANARREPTLASSPSSKQQVKRRRKKKGSKLVHGKDGQDAAVTASTIPSGTPASATASITTLASLAQQGVSQISDGVKTVLGWIGYLFTPLSFIGDGLIDFMPSFSQRHVALSDCLRMFSEEERLCAEAKNQYACNTCGLQDASKRTTIQSLPEVLCISIKRFRFSHGFLAKDHTHVDFPVELTITKEHLSEDLCQAMGSNEAPQYCLSSVICHTGGFGSGHYFAYCRDTLTNEWFMFNDQQVYSVSEATVLGAPAYVLVYQRVNKQAQEAVEDVLKHVSNELENPPQDNYVLVSNLWLSKLFSLVEPGPINSWDVACKHGKLRIDGRAPIDSLTQHISTSVYEQLKALFGESSPPCVDDMCWECQELLCAAQMLKQSEAAHVEALTTGSSQQRQCMGDDMDVTADDVNVTPDENGTEVAKEGPSNGEVGGASDIMVVMPTYWTKPYQAFLNDLRCVTERPGPIDFTVLRQKDGSVRTNLRMSDYMLIPRPLFAFLQGEYGSKGDVVTVAHIASSLLTH
eukprot:m.128224 g.128224  ORF g.128224 m.128224 type:complete len:732 (+) comp13867_c0_seq2:79-2274(+)